MSSGGQNKAWKVLIRKFVFIEQNKKKGTGNLGIDCYPEVTETVIVMNHA